MSVFEQKIKINNDRITSILNNWKFYQSDTPGKFEKKYIEIKDWLSNFEISEIEDALKILENTDYYKYEDFKNLISDLSEKIKKELLEKNLSNVYFFGLGEYSSDSGTNFLYEFQRAMKINNSYFPLLTIEDFINGKSNSEIDAIVFVDDIIGSGNQALTFFKKNLSKISVPIYYISLFCLKKGFENLNENAGFKKIFTGKMISDEERFFSDKINIFQDDVEKERIMSICQKYGEKLYPKHPLGYDDSQLLIAFEYNTPNNTLPIIWSSTNNESSNIETIWHPIFERRKIKVNNKTKSNEDKTSNRYIQNIPQTYNRIFGRELDFKRINHFLNQKKCKLLTIIAEGGLGKTALLNEWIKSISNDRFSKIFAWSFYTQGTTERIVSGDLFIEKAMLFFNIKINSKLSPWEKGVKLAEFFIQNKFLVILDGLEPLQHPPFSPNEGMLKDIGIKGFIWKLINEKDGESFCIVTSRISLKDFQNNQEIEELRLKGLNPKSGIRLLKYLGVNDDRKLLIKIINDCKGHGLLLVLIGNFLKMTNGGKIKEINKPDLIENEEYVAHHLKKILHSYVDWFGEGFELRLILSLGFFDRPIKEQILYSLINKLTNNISKSKFSFTIEKLRELGLIYYSKESKYIDMHPVIRQFFTKELKVKHNLMYLDGNKWLFDFFKQESVLIPHTLSELETIIESIIFASKSLLYDEAINLYYQKLIGEDERLIVDKIGAYTSLLFCLSHFYEDGDWYKIFNDLSNQNKLFILKETGKYLSVVEGYGSENAANVFREARSLTNKETKKEYLLEILLGQCRYYRLKGKLNKSKEIADEISILESEKFSSTIFSDRGLASFHFYMGCFQESLKYSSKYNISNISLKNADLDINEPIISCIGYQALNLWILGNKEEAFKFKNRAYNLAMNLKHNHTTIITVFIECMLYQFAKDKRNTKTKALELKEICIKYGISLWAIAADILMEWSNNEYKSIKNIKNKIKEWDLTGGKLFGSYWCLLLAEKYIEFNKYKEAVNSAKEGLCFSEKWCSGNIYKILGICYSHLNQITESKDYFNKAVAIYKEQDALEMLMDLYKLDEYLKTQNSNGSKLDNN